MKNWSFIIEWKLEDLWIGAFWRRDGNCFDLWVCLLPCLPLHFSCWGARWGMPSLDLDDEQSAGVEG